MNETPYDRQVATMTYHLLRAEGLRRAAAQHLELGSAVMEATLDECVGPQYARRLAIVERANHV
jgi:hypothetical protein